MPFEKGELYIKRNKIKEHLPNTLKLVDNLKSMHLASRFFADKFIRKISKNYPPKEVKRIKTIKKGILDASWENVKETEESVINRTCESIDSMKNL